MHSISLKGQRRERGERGSGGWGGGGGGLHKGIGGCRFLVALRKTRRLILPAKFHLEKGPCLSLI